MPACPLRDLAAIAAQGFRRYHLERSSVPPPPPVLVPFVERRFQGHKKGVGFFNIRSRELRVAGVPPDDYRRSLPGAICVKRMASQAFGAAVPSGCCKKAF